MKMTISIFLLTNCLACVSQNIHQTNAWFLSQFRFEHKKNSHNIEFGHRRKDDFLTNHRQSLFRYTYGYQKKKEVQVLGVD